MTILQNSTGIIIKFRGGCMLWAFEIHLQYWVYIAGGQVPTKAGLSLPSSTGQGRENIMKCLWVELGAGRDHSPVTVTGKMDSTSGN